MGTKLVQHEYGDVAAFETDLKFVFDNCRTFNAPSTVYFQQADSLDCFCTNLFEKLREHGMLMPFDRDPDYTEDKKMYTEHNDDDNGDGNIDVNIDVGATIYTSSNYDECRQSSRVDEARDYWQNYNLWSVQ